MNTLLHSDDLREQIYGNMKLKTASVQEQLRDRLDEQEIVNFVFLSNRQVLVEAGRRAPRQFSQDVR